MPQEESMLGKELSVEDPGAKSLVGSRHGGYNMG
jgi:hypothetical protein